MRPGELPDHVITRPYDYSHEHPGLNPGNIGYNENLRLSEWEDFFTGGDRGAIVVPFRANKSHIVFHCNTDTLLTLYQNPTCPCPDSPYPSISFISSWGESMKVLPTITVPCHPVAPARIALSVTGDTGYVAQFQNGIGLFITGNLYDNLVVLDPTNPSSGGNLIPYQTAMQ